ncbi:unnamed protein product [Linum trigynum]|uniref:Uncharacterized protein n=1 Tax=Linum trigynum TaxID=586398 RepID=A0AAV2G3N3_9ROSI
MEHLTEGAQPRSDKNNEELADFSGCVEGLPPVSHVEVMQYLAHMRKATNQNVVVQMPKSHSAKYNPHHLVLAGLSSSLGHHHLRRALERKGGKLLVEES